MKIRADIHTHFLINGCLFRRDFMNAGDSPRFYNPFRNCIDFEKAKRGGINLVVFTAYCPGRPLLPRSSGVMNRIIDRFEKIIADSSDCTGRVTRASEVKEVVGSGKMALMLAIEGAHVLDGDPGMMEHFHSRGCRMLTLTHFRSTEFCTSNGLTRKGTELVERMQKLGVIVDVAHLSDMGIGQVADAVNGPFITSHTGVRKLRNLKRNISDEHLRLIRDSGGVAGIMLFPRYLSWPGLRIGVDRVIDHISYVADLIGIEHVAVGSDMDGTIWLPTDFRDASDYVHFMEKLSERGFSSDEIDLVMGENFMRVLGNVCG